MAFLLIEEVYPRELPLGEDADSTIGPMGAGSSDHSRVKTP
jgi:hypothetical protein